MANDRPRNLPDIHRGWVTEILRKARQNIEGEGYLARVALIHSSHDPSQGGGPSMFVVMLIWDSEDGKVKTWSRFAAPAPRETLMPC